MTKIEVIKNQIKNNTYNWDKAIKDVASKIICYIGIDNNAKQ